MTTSTVIDRIKGASIVGATAATSVIAGGARVAADSHTCNPTEGGIRDGLKCASEGSSVNQGSLFEAGGIFDTVISTLLFIVGAISVIMLIIGGIRYLVSAGDQNAVTGAKNTILYAIVGIVVSFLAFAAVDFVIGALESGTDTAATP